MDYGFYSKNESENKTKHSQGESIKEAGQTKISGYWLKIPRLHYYTFNWAEDSLIKQRLKKQKSTFHNLLAKQTYNDGSVLIVLHELSKTGAPILGVELAKRIKVSTNVIIISSRGGALEEVLKDLAIPFVIIDLASGSLSIKNIIKEAKVKRAIINSIASYPIISVLKKEDIPMVSLVHEFYSSHITDPKVFRTLHDSSRAVYYPAPLVANDALISDPLLNQNKVRVYPQGLIRSPTPKNPVIKASVNRLLREIAFDTDEREFIIVLGIGTVQTRKGVDIFISTAQAMIRKKPLLDFKFIWIGDVPGKFHYYDYFVYLQDQIKRCGLTEKIYIIESLPSLEAAYKYADIFFLSSRLDPLPLVSLEAMEYALPIVCFDGASGIADYLKESPITSSTVVPYLDIELAADKIIELAYNPVERKRIGIAQQNFSRRRFDMDTYTESILNELG